MSSDIPEEVVEVEVEEAAVEEEEEVVEEEEEVVAEVAPEAPPPKRRGRPVGSKNKIKVVALEPPEPEPQPVITREPTKRAPRKTKAPIPEPVIPPPVDTSVLILNALREHQQQRAAREAAKYSAWFA